MAERLDEGPFAVHALVELSRSEAPGPRNGRSPEIVQDSPRFAEPVGILGSHLRSIGVATIEFRLNQWRDVDLVDDEVLYVTVDVDVDEVNAAHHDAAEVDGVEGGVGEVDASKRCRRQIHILELSADEIGVAKVSHGLRLRGECDERLGRAVDL